jgi:hypothetical protein
MSIDVRIGYWKNSIDLIMVKDLIEKKELFIIFKYYINNIENPLISIYLMSYDKNEDYKKVIIFENIKIKKIKNLKFYEFCEEIENYLSENWKYLSEKKSIGFRLIMLKEIDENRDIKEEKWKNYSNFINIDLDLEKENLKLKKENLELKNYIKYILYNKNKIK